MFDKFKDYMYYLLHGPLKKIIKKNNQFYILFKVFGKLFDKTKEDIFKVREQLIILTASERMLEEHGIDRSMKRLKGEDTESYRRRLLMKNIIAEKAGTNEGILLALSSLGYESSRIEPYYLYDPTLWAEFIIYLDGKNQSNIRDLDIINEEVMKVKPASAKPNYGTEKQANLVLEIDFKAQYINYPICGAYICGTHPSITTEGVRLQETGLTITTEYINASHQYPITDGSNECGTYPSSTTDGIQLQGTDLSLGTKHIDALYQYEMTGQSITKTKE